MVRNCGDRPGFVGLASCSHIGLKLISICVLKTFACLVTLEVVRVFIIKFVSIKVYQHYIIVTINYSFQISLSTVNSLKETIEKAEVSKVQKIYLLKQCPGVEYS